MICLRAGKRDEVIGKLEGFGFVATVDAQLSLRIGFPPHERNGLPETSFGAGAFQSHRLELFGDVKRGDLPALRAGTAALESIVGQKLDMRAQGIFTYVTG